MHELRLAIVLLLLTLCSSQQEEKPKTQTTEPPEPEQQQPPRPSYPSDRPYQSLDVNSPVVDENAAEEEVVDEAEGGKISPKSNTKEAGDREPLPIPRQRTPSVDDVADVKKLQSIHREIDRTESSLDNAQLEVDDDGEDEEYPDTEEETEFYTTDDGEILESPTRPTRIRSPQELYADEVFENAMTLLNMTSLKSVKDTNARRAYKLLEEASVLGHRGAKELVAFAFLFGDFLPWNPRRAKELFDELSVKGSPRGQLGLGFLYSSGTLVNSSQAKALVFFTFSSLGGDSWAQMALGYRYWSGINLKQSCEAALTHYRKVASRVATDISTTSGTAVARIRLADEADGNSGGTQPLMDNDLLQYYRFLADKGDVQAQVGLGQLYMTGGRGMEQNLDLAYDYFQYAAEAGNPSAYAYLGKIYLEGTSKVKANNRTALEYFKRAADKGNPVGQSGLGLMYLYGKGVEIDFAKALKNFQMAAEQGWVDGQLQLGTMYYKGIGVRRDYKAAIKYFQLASQSGHVLAFFNLAQMHATGTGMIRNCQTATELYKNVAERGRWSEMLMQAHSMYKDGLVDQAMLKYLFLAELGYEVAQNNVAFILDSGLVRIFAPKEVHSRGIIQWQRAAEQGSGYARLRLGDYHYYGYGTAVDYEQATQQYKLASEQQHNAQAMFNLAYMHEQGLGIKRDIHLAKRFYDLALETSTDAFYPVTLALGKLLIIFGLQYFRARDIWQLKYLDRYFGPDWDIMVMVLLVLLLLSLVYLRLPAMGRP